MKIIRRKTDQKEIQKTQREGLKAPWKLLIVDDEPDVLAVTRLGLKNFQFMGRRLHFVEADSAAKAMELLEHEADIALALIDVVMESDDAGLKLVNYIRNELGNSLMRLIIRTGQPGAAPERQVVDRYDIDDYKDKTELTIQKLYTTVRTALKGYHDLHVIEGNRQGLKKILDAAPELYHPSSLHDFFEGVLTQVIGLCNLGSGSFVTTVQHGAIITSDKNDKAIIQSCRGNFSNSDEVHKNMLNKCITTLLRGDPVDDLPENIHLFPLQFNDQILGIICLEYSDPLDKNDQDLVRIMVNQSASALQNIKLYEDLIESRRQAVRMLAIATEFRDKETGRHINRIQHYTVKVAQKLGLTSEEAEFYGLTSILHDIGKVAIPDAILHKPGKLTEGEFDVIKEHPRLGLEILKNSDWFELAQQIAYSHHEHWDGNGYPEGLQRDSIPLAARIVAVVDVFDALVNERVYKPAWTREEALDELRRGSGKQFDPAVVDAFITLCLEDVDFFTSECSTDSVG